MNGFDFLRVGWFLVLGIVLWVGLVECCVGVVLVSAVVWFLGFGQCLCGGVWCFCGCVCCFYGLGCLAG